MIDLRTFGMDDQLTLNCATLASGHTLAPSSKSKRAYTRLADLIDPMCGFGVNLRIDGYWRAFLTPGRTRRLRGL